MKLSQKHQTVKRKNSENCVVTVHQINDDMLDFVIVTLNGRYPPEGRAQNQECKELIYVHKGTGTVNVDGKEHALNEGDLILIEPGEKFYWHGDFQLHVSCQPAFRVEQYSIVD